MLIRLLVLFWFLLFQMVYIVNGNTSSHVTYLLVMVMLAFLSFSTQCDVDVCGVIFQPMDSQKDLAISHSQKIWAIDSFVYLHTGQLGFILTPIFVEVCPAWDSVMVTFPDEVLDFVRVI